MKSIFFKTVRSTGRSVWAKGKFNLKYEIGKHYEFDPEFPAHGFRYPCCNLDSIHEGRLGSRGGNRVLICYGEYSLYKAVLYIPIELKSKYWTKSYVKEHNRKTYAYLTSSSFDVIGEIFVPKSWINKEIKKPCNNYH